MEAMAFGYAYVASIRSVAAPLDHCFTCSLPPQTDIVENLGVATVIASDKTGTHSIWAVRQLVFMRAGLREPESGGPSPLLQDVCSALIYSKLHVGLTQVTSLLLLSCIRTRD